MARCSMFSARLAMRLEWRDLDDAPVLVAESVSKPQFECASLSTLQRICSMISVTCDQIRGRNRCLSARAMRQL